MPLVTFSSGQQVEVPEGTSVLDAATMVRATSVECCGIEPACGSCRMAVLACMAHVHGDVSVELER